MLFSHRNPTATVQRTNKKVNNDPTLRIQNLSILIRQIKDYYQVRFPSAEQSAKSDITCSSLCLIKSEGWKLFFAQLLVKIMMDNLHKHVKAWLLLKYSFKWSETLDAYSTYPYAWAVVALPLRLVEKALTCIQSWMHVPHKYSTLQYKQRYISRCVCVCVWCGIMTLIQMPGRAY